MWLITRSACHFAPDGIYISTAYHDGAWTWEAEAEVVTDGRPYEVRHTLMDADMVIGHGVLHADGKTGPGTVSAGAVTQWDIENPRLYTLRSELLVDGQAEDVVDTRIGFRRVELSAERGFILNGKPLKLNGVCQHHDLGALGAAFHKDAARRQLLILRAMGVNAVRTAHNPPASAFMDLCDEMGFLVMSELTDIWARPKTPGDYARFFDDWVDRDAASWIRRDRNRPSVILWSVGNEIHDTHIDAEKGEATFRRLLDLVLLHDPKRNAPATLCSNYMAWENTQKCADIVKIIGYNYAEHLYAAHHKAHPDWVIYGSETCSTLQSRGVYHFPLSRAILADDDLQCSSLGNSTTSWGAKNVEACIRDDLDAPFSLGQFVWSGIDYLGEPTPYDTKNCYFGQADTAGFEKDSYYMFKAAWTDYKSAPFVHVFPYWDFSPGQLIDVRVCSNAPRAALFFDGEMVGDMDLTGCWVANRQIVYRPGVLRAEAYDEDGAVVASMERASFGDAIALKTERFTYGELDFITITAEDARGRPVENANHRVRVNVEGGELLALDNGDSTDYETYHSASRRLFSGKLLAIVRREGDIEPRVFVEPDKSDIPIRKIELLADGFNITAKPYPSDATHSDLRWRLTGAGGADSPAEIAKGLLERGWRGAV
jgi:beta-galactosidase